MAESMLDDVRVSEIMHHMVCDALTIEPDATIDDLLKILVNGARTRHVYVVDSRKHLLGSVRLHGLIDTIFPISSAWQGGPMVFMDIWETLGAHHVSDVMDSQLRYVNENSTLGEMLSIMREDRSNEIPVVDSEMKVVGEVNLLEVIQRYLEHRSEKNDK
ncbi:MAG: hypothetical protein CVV64_13440 [Candidatus Wallbacteria bacterium HGW-Wallbacteria-1]|jgi:CBS domain-containing protein|uniref:CBS domain-containing protein n=1 Tax=Candidatus Wallbacteria bacterium HGW-Wallbacteria-1 TaxID=2013854 RepID=A0A2N1PMM6_9BACT|nr:MAG: hypothetical protein CVV64_13440 [Candidatus Wallbacteria bacterium HGW-Wallbacteria-1]